MKKLACFALGLLLMAGLAGCARVPQEKLDAAREQHQRILDKYQQMLTYVEEADALGKDLGVDSLLPPEAKATLTQLQSDVDERSDLVDNQLDKLKEAEVDQLIGVMGEDEAELDKWLPTIENMVTSLSGYVDVTKALAEKTEQLSTLLDTAEPTQEVIDAVTNMQNKFTEAQNQVYALAGEIDTLAETDPDASVEKLDEMRQLMEDMNAEIDSVLALLENNSAAAA